MTKMRIMRIRAKKPCEEICRALFKELDLSSWKSESQGMCLTGSLKKHGANVRVGCRPRPPHFRLLPRDLQKERRTGVRPALKEWAHSKDKGWFEHSYPKTCKSWRHHLNISIPKYVNLILRSINTFYMVEGERLGSYSTEMFPWIL